MRQKILIAVVVALVVVAAVPPVDVVTPPREALIHMGTILRAAEPEVVRNGGFKFIGSLEFNEVIRMSQWIVELGVVAVLGVLLLVATDRRRDGA